MKKLHKIWNHGMILKFIQKYQELECAKQFGKKNQVKGLTQYDFKTSYKSIVIKRVWQYVKMDKYRLKSLVIDPHICGQLILTKVQRQMEKGRNLYPIGLQWVLTIGLTSAGYSGTQPFLVTFIQMSL